MSALSQSDTCLVVLRYSGISSTGEKLPVWNREMCQDGNESQFEIQRHIPAAGFSRKCKGRGLSSRFQHLLALCQMPPQMTVQ